MTQLYDSSVMGIQTQSGLIYEGVKKTVKAGQEFNSIVNLNTVTNLNSWD